MIQTLDLRHVSHETFILHMICIHLPTPIIEISISMAHLWWCFPSIRGKNSSPKGPQVGMEWIYYIRIENPQVDHVLWWSQTMILHWSNKEYPRERGTGIFENIPVGCSSKARIDGRGGCYRKGSLLSMDMRGFQKLVAKCQHLTIKASWV